MEAKLDAAILAAQLNAFSFWCHKANEKWWLDLTKPCGLCEGKGTRDVRSLASRHTFAPAQPRLCIDCNGAGYFPKDRNVGELLMLMVSELAEAMEGDRKNLMDDKLPHRKQLEVEVADCLIRIFDFCGGKGLDVGGAFVEKMAYNAVRADHKIENRLNVEGKKY